jgi:hypothetical protein
VTPTIVVQAAVVGNRYQVDRVVARALRNYDRANGERR